MNNLDDKLSDEYGIDYDNNEPNENSEESFLAPEEYEDNFTEDKENFIASTEDHELNNQENYQDEESAVEHQDNLDENTFNEKSENEFLDQQVDSLQEFLEKNEVPQSTTDQRFNLLKQDELDSISFKISCEIGTTSISLLELSKLKIGDCINFTKWPTKVKLKLNDYLFAEGYLVEVDGMLGVKITGTLNLSNLTPALSTK